MFGIGADLDEPAWRGVFRQLVALGLVEVDHGAYGALKLAPASRPVLKGEARVEMRAATAAVARPRRERSRAAAALAAADVPLLERLRAWRLAEARSQGVPAYVILHDTTLAELAQRRPRRSRSWPACPGSAPASSSATARACWACSPRDGRARFLLDSCCFGNLVAVPGCPSRIAHA